MDNLFLDFEKKHTVEVDLTPEWAKRNDVSLLAYNLALKKAEEIETNLQKTPEKLMDKLLVSQKQIIIADLAKDIGCSRAALSKARRPELHELVYKINIKLSAHYKINAQRKSSGRKARKDELEARCNKLQKNYDAAVRIKVSEILNDIFNNKLNEQQRLLIVKLESTQQQLNKYKENSFQKNNKIQSLMKQLDSADLQIQKLKSGNNKLNANILSENEVLKSKLAAERKENEALYKRINNLLNQLNDH